MSIRGDYNYQSRRSNALGTRGMVATSQPMAVQAALSILEMGGSAADAAIAAAAMLNVVEPVSTGVGGDCFALYWDNNERNVFGLNGSGRSAAATSLSDILDMGYREMPKFSAQTVTVPGAAAGWCDLLERFGQLPRAEVFAPAISVAETGFPVTEIIADSWAMSEKKLLRSPEWDCPDWDAGPAQESGKELLLNGRAPRAGEIMRIPTLATTLRGIAEHGSKYIYHGDFAQRLCSHLDAYGGWLTPGDLAAHQSEWVEPLGIDYGWVTLWECPPNGQGLAALIAARLASEYDFKSMDELGRVHTLIECMRLAFADAFEWVAEPEGAQLPVEQLLSDPYIDKRRKIIKPTKAATHVDCGVPGGGSDTVYISVVDADGNACSFINSLYMGTGTGLVVPGTGVSLQNRGNGFSLKEGHPNLLAPNKRPYHTIIPAMTTSSDELHACFGVMGGFMQPQGHLQMLVNMVDLDMSPQQALDAPRWQIMVKPGSDGVGAGQAGGAVMLEPGFNDMTRIELTRRGHVLKNVRGSQRGQMGGGQIIMREGDLLIGGSDPRKDGMALGLW